MNLTPHRRALAAYLDDPEAVSISPLGDGLINDTYLVAGPHRLHRPAEEPAPEQSVLQRVNPIFGIAVHEDIEAITRHLQGRGLATPLLYRAFDGDGGDGGLAVDLGPDGVWRLLSFIPGHSTSLMQPELCHQAGLLAGRFHQALSDLSHSFRFSRPGAHDLHAHLAALQGARAQPAAPAGFAEVADEVLERAATLPAQVPGPLRICHGDLKISNVRFDDQGRGLCLLDLDTLAHLPILIEMGDALRSWCNPSPLGEDDAEATFDLGLFERALSGYAGAARSFLTSEEQLGLVDGVERIALELSARFCADVVNDRYFRWDPRRFPSRAAHNLQRARGQLSMARSIQRQRGAAEAVLGRVFEA